MSGSKADANYYGHCAEYNALVDLYADLNTALPIKKLFPSLISNRVIDIHDKEELSNEASRLPMVQKFIDDHLFPELATKETARFYRFLNVMRRSEKCNHLVKKLERKISHHESLVQTPAVQPTSVLQPIPIEPATPLPHDHDQPAPVDQPVPVSRAHAAATSGQGKAITPLNDM